MSSHDTGRFFVPGPTEVRAEILQAMTGAMMPHRSKAFETLYATLQEGLREVFVTSRTVLISSSSATGMMEGAVRCAPEGPILALVNGAFSKRFGDIAAACGREAVLLEAPAGSTVPLDQVDAALAGRRFAAVLVVHSETSTGARSDIRGVTALARRHGALALVDSVSGVGGIPLAFDDWDLDFVLTGSQKALALPPGLAFAVASDRYLQHAKSNPARGRYFDIAELQSFAERNQTPATPAISLLYALAAQLQAIHAEGISARWARHAEMASITWQWAESAEARLGLAVGILAEAGARCETVSAITLPAHLNAPDLVQAVAARGYILGEGYGPLKQRTFRIGHMGDHTPDGVRKLLTVIDQTIAEFKRS